MQKKIILTALCAALTLGAMEVPASAHPKHHHNGEGLKVVVAVLSALNGGGTGGGGVSANGGNGGICILSVNSCNGGNGGNGGTINHF